MTKTIQLLDFYTSNCGACQMVSAVLDQMTFPETVQVEKINAEEHPELAGEHRVFAVPTLILLKDGEVIKRHQGFLPQSMIEAWLKEVE